MNVASIQSIASASAEWLQNQWTGRPHFGIVLGTGAGEVARAIVAEKVFPYRDIPNFPVSTAIGHAGKLVCGKLAGVNVVAMQGRFHLYEGYSVELATLGIRVMHQLGIKKLFVSNAAGGINPNFVSGDIMMIDSHLDLMFRRAQPTNFWNFERTTGLRSDQAYDQPMMEQAAACARRNNFALHRGVYVGMLGPNYETRAEYRYLRRLGGDTVGMSTIPEVCVATELGIRVLGLSIVTNVAKPDSLDPTSGEEVVAFADIAAPKLRTIIEDAVSRN
ncbi:MAG: purine-nucleoside phosphorylase [Pirellulaceae bacterium]